MTQRRLQSQGKPFAFKPEHEEAVAKAIAQYPLGKQASAVKSLLHLVQEQEGWVSQEAVEEVAKRLSMPLMRVYEVATFYTMFKLAPGGRIHVQVCTTTPCWLRGADDLWAQCEKRAAQVGSEQLTVEEVECVGACVNAPVVCMGGHFYEDMDATSLTRFLDRVLAGDTPEAGSQIGRLHSAPLGYGSPQKKGPTRRKKDVEV